MLNNKDLMSKKRFIKTKNLPDITLTATEADKFLDYVIDESVWKDNARIVKMSKNEKNIRRLGFGSGRFLKPASTFSSSDYKKEFADDKVTLSTKKVRGAIEIFDDDLEDNIEGQAFADHLMKMIANKVANEIDEAAYVSESTNFSSTDIRSLWSGFRNYLLTFSATDIVSAPTKLDASSDWNESGKIAEYDTTNKIWEIKYPMMLANLDSKYKVAGMENLRFFQNDIFSNDYIEALAGRGTVLGDQAVLGTAPLAYGGIPIQNVPLMPSNYASGVTGTEAYGSGDYGDCILTNKDNFIIGLQRELKLESQRVPEDEAQRIFYSMRVDFKVENPEAVVFTHDITHS